jgi:maltose O-acetyltransferase
MNYLKRRLLIAIYYGFLYYLPPSYYPGGSIFRRLRYVVCKELFDKCGKNVNVESHAFIHNGTNVRIGDNSGIGVNCRIYGRIIIGKNVLMGQDVVIITNNHAFSRTDIPIMEQGYTEINPVYIGDNVWIGDRVIILDGITIGAESIIGAGSVVTKNIPEWAIAGGNPAKIIRFRKEI